MANVKSNNSWWSKHCESAKNFWYGPSLKCSILLIFHFFW